MKKFLENLRKELKKLNFKNDEIEEIISDHEEMIGIAKEQGLTDEELHLKFGDPEKLAQDLKENTTSFVVEKGGNSVEGYTLLKTFPVLGKTFNVEINIISDDIKYEIHDEDQIEVHYKNISDIDKYEVGFDGQTFTLKRHEKSRIFSFTKSSGKFIVRVPEGITSDEFHIISVSGDGKATGINTKELAIKTTSGDFKLRAVQAEETKVATVSGDLVVESAKFQSLSCSMVSGDATLNSVTVEEDITVNTVSGDMKIEDTSCENFTFKTVSGDCKGKEFYPKTISSRSVSGDLKIENSKEQAINILKQTAVSGKVKIK